MIFTRYLLSKFMDISGISNAQIAQSLNTIGLEVESMREIVVPKKVVLGKVVEKSKHPDADKLSVCKVNVGSEVLQIVCGAKNVAEGQIVPVALVGAELSKAKIAATTLRGVKSNGMICSSSEIDLPSIEAGIFVLDESIGEIVLGRELREYEIFNDMIFEIAITPNRGDCLSVMGIARELAVVFDRNIEMCAPKLPTSDTTPGIGRILSLAFDGNLRSSLHYKVVEMQKLEPTAALNLALAISENLSKDSLQNLVVFASYMTGVVLNAYEFNGTDKIIFRISKDSRGVESVNCDNQKLYDIGIARESARVATSDSHLVVLEASYIPPQHISNIIYEHKIKGDEGILYRSTRGSSPLLEDGMRFLCYLISKSSNSVIYSSHQEITQDYPLPGIHTSYQAINNIIGNDLANEEILGILKRLNFAISAHSAENFIVTPPPYRHDIDSIQDVAEEVLRIKGIDNITSIPQLFTQSKNIDENYATYKFKRFLAHRAMAETFFESIHYMFYKREILESYGYEVLKKELDIANPINTDLNTLRTALLPAMLDSVARNRNYGYESMRLFEIGSVYDSARNERESIAFVASGNMSAPRYPHPKGESWDFYAFAEAISRIIGDFELVQCAPKIAIFHPNMSAQIVKCGNPIGVIGKISPYIAKKLDIESDTFMAEMSFDKLLGFRTTREFEEFSKYQHSARDMSILIDKTIPFSAVKDALNAQHFPNLRAITPLDIYESKEFGEKISLSFRLTFQNASASLTEEDLRIDNIVAFLEREFGATLR